MPEAIAEQLAIADQLAIAGGSVSLSAPDSAEQGDRVSVSVRVQNTLGYHASFRTEVFAGTDLIFGTSEVIMDGQSETYGASFTMPASDVTVFAWVERWAFDHWVYWGSDSKRVALYVPPPPPVPPPCSISITAPASAEQGETVSLSARITNNSSYAEVYKVEMYAGADFIGSITDTIPGGSSKTYGGSFTMPASDITILVWVEVSYLDEWRYSNSASRTVTLAPEVVAWVVLAQEHIAIAIPAEVVAWVQLAEEPLTITVPEVVAWVILAEEEITIAIPEVVAWVVLAEEEITIAIPEVVGWVVLAEEEINITIAEVVPMYELVYHHEYPRGKTYVGKAEECTTTFTVPLPEQLFPSSWVIEKVADAFADEVAKEGGEMLDIKIYEDATPTWHTDYKIVAAAIASPLPWALIILLILAIILVVAFTNLVVQFKDIDWGEIPAAIPWAILAAVGGVAVLGVGAAVALAGRPRG